MSTALVATDRPISLSLFMGKTASLLRLSFNDGLVAIVPGNEQWLILNGYITHVNLTPDVLTVSLETPNFGATVIPFYRASIASGDATEQYDIFGSQCVEKHSGWQPVIINPTGYIHFNGSVCRLTILKVKI